MRTSNPDNLHIKGRSWTGAEAHLLPDLTKMICKAVGCTCAVINLPGQSLPSTHPEIASRVSYRELRRTIEKVQQTSARQLTKITKGKTAPIWVMGLPVEVNDTCRATLLLVWTESFTESPEMVQRCEDMAHLTRKIIATLRENTRLHQDFHVLQNDMAELQSRSENDALTDVLNKTAFESHAAERLQAPHTHWALLAIDIDHFKQVNDVFGHQFGDTFLKRVADCLRNSFTTEGLIGRIGGDEFCVLIKLSQSGASIPQNMAEHFRNNLQRTAAVMGHPDLGRVSVGIAQFPEHARNYKELHAKADNALYIAKEAGRNCAVLYSGSPQTDTTRSGIAARFHTALKNDLISVTFSPILDARTGQVCGVDGQPRWLGAHRGNFLKEALASVASEPHMAKLMTRRTLRKAMAAFASARRGVQPMAPSLWLNVTPFDLRDPEFVFDVQANLSRFGVNWRDIVIKLVDPTGHGIASPVAERALKELRRRGAGIAFANFGARQGSLLQLKTCPVDILMLDGAFSEDLEHDTLTGDLARAIIRVARSLQKSVVFTNICSESQMAITKDMGANFQQGPYVSEIANQEKHAFKNLSRPFVPQPHRPHVRQEALLPARRMS